MSRKPSAETQLRTAMRELKETGAENFKLRVDNSKLIGQVTILTSEVDQWKRRFDQLLKVSSKQ